MASTSDTEMSVRERRVQTTSLDDASNSMSKKKTKPLRYSFQKKPFVIGVAGGTASGKSTVCSKIMNKLGPVHPNAHYLTQRPVICISQDSFYRKLSDDERALAATGNFNFDHPSAFDVKLMVQTLRDVQYGKTVRIPVYNYEDNEVGSSEEVIYPADVVLVEGLLLFYFPEVREMFHMKVFVDTDPDTRLARRVMRDVNVRHRPLDFVLNVYKKFVKPSFEEFCFPTKKFADIIVPRGPDNEVAVDLIVTHVRSIFDPSKRHQSIKYHDESDEDCTNECQPMNRSKNSAKKKNRKTNKKGGRSKRVSNESGNYSPILSVINGKCITPTLNGNYSIKNKENGIGINGTHHGKYDAISPILLSSSAPSHLAGFDQLYHNGYDNGDDATTIVTNGKCNGHLETDDEYDDLPFASINGHSEVAALVPSVTISSCSMMSPSKAKKNGSVKNGNSGNKQQQQSQQQPSAAAIVLVAIAIDLIVQTIRDLITNVTTTSSSFNKRHHHRRPNGRAHRHVVSNGESFSSTPSTPIDELSPSHHGQHVVQCEDEDADEDTDDDEDQSDKDDHEPRNRTRHLSDSGKDISYNRIMPKDG
ncbi:hypothetical protein RDWZM_006962 [Blomia tropicalis]|uniref:uridine/cytidine kinase n=1 Tax=Blomia tropicalis TaxID=40697 RepID=A0A9Q0MCB0_BLOTA|nr:hypothetical protein RDWZM_006962 [Blomia tropicalis]